MTTTPHEKDRLISAHLWLIGAVGASYKATMNRCDYEEAESDAMLSVSKAIDNYDETLGTLVTFIRRHIITSFKHTVNERTKRASRQSAFEQYVSCFSDLPPDDDGTTMPDYGKPDSDPDGKIWKEMVIRTVSSPRHRRILNMRLDGLTFIEIGRRVGITKQRAQHIYAAANAEIRENIKGDEE